MEGNSIPRPGRETPPSIIPTTLAVTPMMRDFMAPSHKDATWVAIGVCWVTAFMGFYCSAAGLEGFSRRKLKIWERLIFLAAAFLLYSIEPWKIAVGTVLMVLGMGLQRFYKPSTGADSHQSALNVSPRVQK